MYVINIIIHTNCNVFNIKYDEMLENQIHFNRMENKIIDIERWKICKHKHNKMYNKKGNSKKEFDFNFAVFCFCFFILHLLSLFTCCNKNYCRWECNMNAVCVYQYINWIKYVKYIPWISLDIPSCYHRLGYQYTYYRTGWQSLVI